VNNKTSNESATSSKPPGDPRKRRWIVNKEMEIGNSFLNYILQGWAVNRTF
jgi:hypothetical protein